MNVRTNPDWADFKATAVAKLGHSGTAALLRFAAASARNIGPDGMVEHFEFAARQVELEGRRTPLVIEGEYVERVR